MKRLITFVCLIILLVVACPAWATTYILHDTFINALVGTDDTGNYTRVIQDTEGKLSIVGGALVCAGGKASPAWGDPRIAYSPAIVRGAGKAIRVRINPTAATGSNLMTGWNGNSTPASSLDYGINSTYTAASGQWLAMGSSSIKNGPAAFNRVPNAYQQYMVVMRATGAYTFGYGGAFPKPTLLWVNTAGTANEYACFSNYNMPFSISDFAVLDLTQFTDGIDWTGNGLATSASATPASGDTATMTKDALVEVTWTPAANDVLELSFRRVDDDNRWLLRCDQAAGTIKLYKREGGVETEFDSGKTQTFTAATAYRITAMCDFERMWSFVDSTKKHDVFAASGSIELNPFNITATGAKVLLTGTGTLANFICWPRHPAMSLSGWLPITAPKQIVLTGDSIPSAGQLTFPKIISSLAIYPWYSTYGIGGERVTTGRSPYTTTMELDEGVNFADKAINSACQNKWCLVWAGTNDCWITPISITNTTTHTALQAFCAARRAAGYKVAVCTMLPRGLHTDVGWSDYETWRTGYNTLIRNNYHSYADLLIDTALYTETNWGTYPAENATYMAAADRTHPTAAGGTALGTLIANAIDGYVPPGGWLGLIF